MACAGFIGAGQTATSKPCLAEQESPPSMSRWHDGFLIVAKTFHDLLPVSRNLVGAGETDAISFPSGP
ncbi:hypothetical protein IMZ48_46225 [Candidatus Bathyarchaeota archaeon]|nr:hypothetical protein [Candidatus Bathyarchaeota archaeon]